MNITFKKRNCPKCGGDLEVLVDGIAIINEDGKLSEAVDLDVLSISCENEDWDAETEDEVNAFITRDGSQPSPFEQGSRMAKHDETVKQREGIGRGHNDN